jgi:hypothetical protein
MLLLLQPNIVATLDLVFHDISPLKILQTDRDDADGEPRIDVSAVSNE